MDPETLRILHAPAYGPRFTEAHLHRAEATGADSIGYSEAYRVANHLDSARYVGVVGHSQVDTRRVASPCGDAGDNPMAVKRTHAITRRVARKITRPGRPRKFAPERYLYAVTYRWHGHKVTHVNLHPSPLFCGRLPWLRILRAALAEVRHAKRAGHLVVLTGDLNNAGSLTYGLLRAAGLKVWREHIDYVCHNRALRIVGRQVIHVDGFDHPWMLADLQPVVDNRGGRAWGPA